jgi:hypothetical protein
VEGIMARQVPCFRSVRRALTVAGLVLCGAVLSSGQNTAKWLRQYQGKYPASIAKDPRFAADIHRWLAANPSGHDLAKVAASYMTNGANDDVQIGEEEVTVNGCANHGGECALLWTTSHRSADKATTLALCLIDASVRVYVSSRSITDLPPQLRDSIQAWRDYLAENGIFLHPEKAFLVTSDGRSYPLSVKTLDPETAK